MKLSTAGVLALAATLALPAGCKKDQPADLVIVSPHNKDIEEEFETAFVAWHRQRHGEPVRLQWRDMGGTNQIVKFLKAQYSRSAGCGIDVFFGGGAPAHKSLARHGYLQPIELPPEVLAAIPESIRGVRQYDRQAGWYGACVSSFGIIYNAKLMSEKGLSAPRTWDDLSHPRMANRTTAAGPDSGSAIAAYEMMLQTAADWPTGWLRLLGFWGNCQKFTQGASDVPGEVVNGQVLAGTAIDFYAHIQMTKAPPGVLAYVTPTGGEVFTPDPISVLKGAPHQQMARRFVEFVLSTAGQGLWCLPAGTEGGPSKATLYRQPIRTDAYRIYKGRMQAGLVDVPALAGEGGLFKLDEKLQSMRMTHILPKLMQAAAIDNATSLRRAWKVILDRGQPADLMGRFAELPDDLATIDALLATAARLEEADKQSDAKTIELITGRWRSFFRAKYQAIISGG